jgi:hypothetical protein
MKEYRTFMVIANVKWEASPSGETYGYIM